MSSRHIWCQKTSGTLFPSKPAPVKTCGSIPDRHPRAANSKNSAKPGAFCVRPHRAMIRQRILRFLPKHRRCLRLMRDNAGQLFPYRQTKGPASARTFEFGGLAELCGECNSGLPQPSWFSKAGHDAADVKRFFVLSAWLLVDHLPRPVHVPRVVPVTAPRPLFRPQHSSTLDGIAMHIAEFLDPLLLREHHKIIKPRLPDTPPLQRLTPQCQVVVNVPGGAFARANGVRIPA